MDSDEIAVFAISVLAAVWGTDRASVAWLHRLFFRGNAALGLVRLAVLGAMLWIAFVLWQFADPSVTGIYVFFYLVLGYAVTTAFGLQAGAIFGPRLRVDVYERKNLAAGVFIAAFALATAMIFGGSLWGEADPEGGGEGGWWIPLGFFVLGWSILMLAVALYLRGERGSFRVNVRQNRRFEDAQALSVYILGVAVVVTEAVAGDFFGWRHGLASLGAVIVMLVIHELAVARLPGLPTTAETPAQVARSRRLFESAAYALLAVGFWVMHRVLDRWTGELAA